MQYIAILRGINVSGKNILPMAELRTSLNEAGFSDVSTYIQSGNIAFTIDIPDQKKIAANIRTLIKEKFGYNVPVIVLNGDELKTIQSENPFLSGAEVDVKHLHVTFLEEVPSPENLASISVNGYFADEFVIKAKAVYLHCPAGYGKTKLNNTFFEKKLGVTATTRNWKTVGKLVEMIG